LLNKHLKGVVRMQLNTKKMPLYILMKAAFSHH
jgi:hypothetical protein